MRRIDLILLLSWINIYSEYYIPLIELDKLIHSPSGSQIDEIDSLFIISLKSLKTASHQY